VNARSAKAPRPQRNRTAVFRFYAQLNEFLPPESRGAARRYDFSGNPSVKDAIEAQGIPHPEVDLILADRISVGFDYQLSDGDRIAVYPAFTTFDTTASVRLRPALTAMRFVVDVNLGKLARWLRLLGFDTLYQNDFADPEVVALGKREERVVLTRDRRLLHHADVVHGYWVRSNAPETQIIEVLGRFHLEDQIHPYRRCLRCNGLVHPVSKANVLDKLLPKTRRHYDNFYQCDGCAHVYWHGPHIERLNKQLARWLTPSTGTDKPQ
jgi:uncharacterized protein with PIN domain